MDQVQRAAASDVPVGVIESEDAREGVPVAIQKVDEAAALVYERACAYLDGTLSSYDSVREADRALDSAASDAYRWVDEIRPRGSLPTGDPWRDLLVRVTVAVRVNRQLVNHVLARAYAKSEGRLEEHDREAEARERVENHRYQRMIDEIDRREARIGRALSSVVRAAIVAAYGGRL